MKRFEVPKSSAHVELGTFLAKEDPESSRGLHKRLGREGRIKVNGIKAATLTRTLLDGDVVEIGSADQDQPMEWRLSTRAQQALKKESYRMLSGNVHFPDDDPERLGDMEMGLTHFVCDQDPGLRCLLKTMTGVPVIVNMTIPSVEEPIPLDYFLAAFNKIIDTLSSRFIGTCHEALTMLKKNADEDMLRHALGGHDFQPTTCLIEFEVSLGSGEIQNAAIAPTFFASDSHHNVYIDFLLDPAAPLEGVYATLVKSFNNQLSLEIPLPG